MKMPSQLLQPTILLALIPHVLMLLLTNTDKRGIVDVVEMTRKCFHIPGLSLSIVSRTEGVLMEAGFGYEDVTRKTAVTQDTLFPIGSNTKAFTSALLAMLKEKHKNLSTSFNWTTPVRSILGDWFALNTPALTCETTLQDILSHRTGLQDYFLLLLAGYPRNFTRRQFVHNMRYFKPEAALRSSFFYNNHVYAIAGHVAETLEHASWEGLVKDRLLAPLGMTETQFVGELTTNAQAGIARSYIYVNGSFVLVDLMALQQVLIAGPSGSIISSAHDMSKWLLFILSGGTTASGVALISSEALQETYEDHLGLNSGNQTHKVDLSQGLSMDAEIQYNLGWIKENYKDRKMIRHGGSISTYKSGVRLFPDQNFGIFVGSNGHVPLHNSTGIGYILDYITAILLKETPSISLHNITEVCKQGSPNGPLETANPFRSDPLSYPITEYLGIYRNEAYGNITISYNNTRSLLALTMGLFLQADLFYNKLNDSFLASVTGLMSPLIKTIPVTFRRGDKSRRDTGMDSLEIQLTLGVSNKEHTGIFAKEKAFVNGYEPVDSCVAGAASVPSINVLVGLVVGLLAMN